MASSTRITAELRGPAGTSIPIIDLLKDKDSGVREAGMKILLKLSEQVEFRRSIGTSIPQIIDLLKDDNSDVREGGAKALSKLSGQAEFRGSIGTSIPRIVDLLKDSNCDVREAGVETLLKLSEQAEFRRSIGTSIPQIVDRLKDENSDVREAGTKVLSKLSEQAEFRGSIGTSIPQIVDLLQGDHSIVREAGAKALSKLSEQADFQGSIGTSIPQIVDLLKDSNYDVREAGVDTLLKLSEQAEFRGSITTSIPRIIGLLKDSNNGVRRASAEALSDLSEQAEFRESIGTSIPEFIDLLKDGDFYICWAGAQVLLELSEEAEFRESIGTSIPQIVDLLKDSDSDFRREAAGALSKLSEQAEFRGFIGTSIPHIVNLLQDSNYDALEAGVENLVKLSKHVEFQASIRTSIPQIVELLKDDNSNVREVGVKALSKLSEQAELQESIGTSIPQIVDLLKDDNSNFREGGAKALSKLSEQAEFLGSVGTSIPQIVDLLKDSNHDVLEAGVETLLKLSSQAEFRGSIRTSIPQIVKLLKDDNSHVREVGVKALSKLSEQAELRESIGTSIPQIVNLLKYSDNNFRREAAAVLSKLSEQAEFRGFIGTSIPQLVSLLKDNNSNVREAGAKALSKLSEQAEFRGSIGTSIPQIVDLLHESDSGFRMAGAEALSKLSNQAEFRGPIETSIPQIVDLLKDDNSHVREAGAKALSKLSEQAEFRGSIRTSIPKMIDLLHESRSDFRMAGADALSKLSEQAEFRGSITTSIPQIVDLLKDDNSNVREAGAKALSKLSEQAEFRGGIGPSIPQVVDLLKDDNSNVREAGAKALSKLSEQAAFRGFNGISIPQILDLLKDGTYIVRRAGANAMIKLLEQGTASPFSPPPLKDRSSVQPQHETVIIQKLDSDFKYRVWFTWHLMQILIPGTAEAATRRREEFWVTAVSRTNTPGDLWFWENGDEEYIKGFTEDHLLMVALEMPMMDWANACRALDTRQPESRLMTPLSHLTPQTRLLFIAWLIVAEPGRMHLQDIIAYWGFSLAHSISDSTAERCDICGVSQLLKGWIETMLEVYSLDDLRSFPWYLQCNCFESQLAAIAHSGRRPTPIHPQRDSAVLRVPFELVVPPWPLILWVIFRIAAKERLGPLQTFLGILCGPDHDLFTWDHGDNVDLYWALERDNRVGLYPQDWYRYMVEIDFTTWRQIGNKTWTVCRPRLEPDDLMIRLTAVPLVFSSAMGLPCSIPGSIQVPLYISLDQFPFDTIAQVASKNYRQQSTLGNFELTELSITQNMNNWLSACTENLCHSIWHTSRHVTTLGRVQSMYMVITVPPENFLSIYTFSLVLQQQSDHRDMFRELWDFKASLSHGRFLESLKQYRFDLDTLFTLLKDCQRSVKNCSTTAHTFSTDVHKHMNLSISVGVARLVLFLQDPGSYTEFLAYRGTDAQALLDLLQDFLDLDSFSVVKPFICKALCRLSRVSGLHPHCFALTGLQKIGQQVGGGGYGDIWKGLVRGQSVCVKIMRIFRNDDIEAVLKEFGREALIWRQLCHPNLLPFFGLYYLDDRLCLVSPWMQNGNIMEFLRREPANTDRLSLILDVARGLEYLHEQKVVHGDLKAINILVTPSGRACIADFGLSSVENAMTLKFPHSTAATRRGGTPCYHAPELFQGQKHHYGSDVYAFACVCYEILTGQRPFHDLKEMAVMFHILEGKHPPRPTSCSDSLWELLQNCRGNAEMRPTAPQIVKRLEGPSIRATTTSSTTDWDDKFTSKFRRSLQTQPLLSSVTQIERMLFGGEVAEACKQCFPDLESSGTGNKKGISELRRQAKHPYEDDVSAGQPGAKRSKLSHGITDA